MHHYLIGLLTVCLFLSCGSSPEQTATDTQQTTPMSQITETDWGSSPEGPVKKYTLTNAAGNTVDVLNYGGIIQSIRIDGAEMVLGFDRIDGYLGENPYYGALIGRYGNRIADAQFTIDGTEYELVANENGNQLHGGTEGFNTKLWRVEQQTTDSSSMVVLSYLSPDGEMGFPGNLNVKCTYEWTDDNALRLHYKATTDKPTIVNLTNHSYFNIGDDSSVVDQVLTLDADRYTPISEELIPLGENESVEGTPFDFRGGKPIGQDIKSDHPQTALASGYDHNWELNDYDGSLREFALLTDPSTGRSMRCFTTEPGVQIFTSNFPPNKFFIRGGAPIPLHGGICLETQHFPDSPNQANFRTPLLKPGETYNTTTIYRFAY